MFGVSAPAPTTSTATSSMPPVSTPVENAGTIASAGPSIFTVVG